MSTALLSRADNFYVSDSVMVKSVTFPNQYRMMIAANLFTPKNLSGRAPAIIVGHPFGAVKEQSANLYATKMAELGFVTVSVDAPFFGSSEGEPRNAVLPELSTEAFSAAVDFLGKQETVNREKIGAIGICGSGAFAISAAKVDSRIKAVATVSMVNMGTAVRSGVGNSQTIEQRKGMVAGASQTRWAESTGAGIQYIGGTVHELKEDTPDFQREFYDFYRTPRGEFTPKSSTPDLTTHIPLTSMVKLLNFYPFNDIETISPRPLLFISGEHANSREFSEAAFARAIEPKELFWVPGAGHVDLYDRVNLIPFAKLTDFFKTKM